jgi:UDPglucose--hexose-1-phosphate uridylyltransferase
MSLLSDQPHRRLNPLTEEWVLVSPHRAKRPWQGKQERSVPLPKLAHDPTCYLCPGNTRIHGEKNPPYTDTFVFTNDHPALLPETNIINPDHPLLTAQSVQGTTRVICFSPRHDQTLADLSVPDIERLIDTWSNQVTELGKTYAWVQLFENKGEIMGCSSPHPHGQVWATQHLPNEALKEDQHQLTYWQQHRRALLLDYVELEQQQKERIVCENNDWLVVVPFWAIWPFETLLLPKFAVTHFPQLTHTKRHTLADILKNTLTRYDRLFGVSFPYSMGWHGAPQNQQENRHWQLHAHFYPPLLRSATVKKFMVGYEMVAEVQRDMTPEQAAKQLRGT